MQKPTVTPSDEENAFVQQILEHTNSVEAGFLTAQAAVDIFNRSGLSRLELRDIWSLSDADSNGRLSQDELVVAIRLMGWMQSGRPFSESLLEKPGPLPAIEGISPPPPPQKDPGLSPLSTFPPIRSANVHEFYQMFQNSGLVDGYLEGDKVRDIFMSFNLAYQDLSLIWTLLDTTSRGRLNFYEFALGMYLIQALRSCHLTAVPQSIPPEVHDELHRVTSAVVNELQSPFLAPGETPVIPMPSPRLPPVPPARSPSVPSKPPVVKPKTATKPWMVLPREKAEYDRSFSELDPTSRGLVSKDDVVNHLQQYQLAEEDLSQICNLASMRKDVHLNAEEFAVAMHLTHSKLKGKDIPQTLPPSLIPPSLRPRSGSISSSPAHPPPPPKPAFYLRTDKELPIPGPSRLPPPPSDHLRHSRSMSFNHYPSPISEGATPRSSSPPNAQSTPPSMPSFLSTEPYSPNRYPTPSPSISRRGTLYGTVASPLSEDDPLEELKLETKTLRKQINTLLEQLGQQNDYRQQNEQLRTENEELKGKISELESNIASVLAQMQNNDNALSEELTKEIERLSSRVAELEQVEHQLQQATGMLQASKRENSNLTSQIRELRSAEANYRSEIEDARHAMEEFERENGELKTRLADMTKVMSEPDTANSARELRVLLRDITRENQGLKERVRAAERSREQLLLSSRDTTQIEDLQRKNRELQMEVQELEQLTAQLQSSQEDNHLQQVLLVVTRENEGMKVRIREMQQERAGHDNRVAEMQRRIQELERENTQLKTESSRMALSSQHHDQDVPPPAYDDSFIPPDLQDR
ncbi:hypothetical protein CC1G_07734 [Coprinopsis cinerea okayama7|uniref:EF-hand n=1 Tax=Coprinopsis cinerea (strain Okayama-7 / 130 / ATCC MYA-4618 / FGSC 9003) TaxID=240176 RepID=A8NBY8_COPC7|nr:hypothetical protein CC1G_07734 [Coprinopsis cinerea okayama7\|eukprot:XP_001832347.1 hypothetical protein CC1G_07734 [Coprinopsis cinerea okayama7\